MGNVGEGEGELKGGVLPSLKYKGHSRHNGADLPMACASFLLCFNRVTLGVTLKSQGLDLLFGGVLGMHAEPPLLGLLRGERGVPL